jgi:hypothetical protein
MRERKDDVDIEPQFLEENPKIHHPGEDKDDTSMHGIMASSRYLPDWPDRKKKMDDLFLLKHGSSKGTEVSTDRSSENI